MPRKTPNDVLARYGNWYHGDDDLFAHCLILRDGRHVLLFQGLQIVTLKSLETPRTKRDKLVHLLDQPIPAAWPNASYQGYNFITDAEGAFANEIAVFGTQPGDTRPAGEYYAAPAASEVGLLVKAIAKID